jgi:hypothetical protein
MVVSMVSIDFKKINKDDYRLNRIMQAPSAIAEQYKRQIRKFGNNAGAIIFPEQAFSLLGSTIYKVEHHNGSDNWFVNVAAADLYTLKIEVDGEDYTIQREDDIYFHEKRLINSDIIDYKIFHSSTINSGNSHTYNTNQFNSLYSYNHCFFTSRKHAITFARTIIK